MSPIDFLLSRRSTPSRLLSAPGPDEIQLDQMLRAATAVPDHGRMVPWRFILIRDAARARLGALLGQRQLERNPEAEPAVVEKDRARFSHAPLIIVVVSHRKPYQKVPEREQLLSAAAACQNLMLSAHALGFGAQWLTGWAAYDTVIQRELGLLEHEDIVGFVHVGTAGEAPPQLSRPEIAPLVSTWTGA